MPACRSFSEGRFADDPAHMSIDDRLEELAALLVAGFLRLKRRTGCLPPAADPGTPDNPAKPADSSKRQDHSTAKEPCRFLYLSFLLRDLRVSVVNTGMK